MDSFTVNSCVCMLLFLQRDCSTSVTPTFKQPSQVLNKCLRFGINWKSHTAEILSLIMMLLKRDFFFLSLSGQPKKQEHWFYAAFVKKHSDLRWRPRTHWQKRKNCDPRRYVRNRSSMPLAETSRRTVDHQFSYFYQIRTKLPWAAFNNSMAASYTVYHV